MLQAAHKAGLAYQTLKKSACGFGIKYEKIDHHQNLDKKLGNILNISSPVICEVILTPDYKFSPKLSSEKLPDGRIVSKPLEDMWPFLEREEFNRNIL